jgi:phospholipid-binding lipoprotein MlaA
VKRTPLLRPLRGLAAGAVLALLGGCAATVPPSAGSNPADPLERMNRHVYAFNDNFDQAVARPVARGYNRVLPKVLRDCLSNFFDNLAEVANLFNATLQGRPGDAARDTGRFLINSTAGVGGCFDVARQIGLERSRQNFGLTMGRWGVGNGPYLVLPFLGPSTVRQTAGLVPDYFLTDPVGYVRPVKVEYGIGVFRILGDRAELLDASQLLEGAALDNYSFIRDGYLQRLGSRIHDGGASPLPVEEDPDAPDPAAPKGAPAQPAAAPQQP